MKQRLFQDRRMPYQQGFASRTIFLRHWDHSGRRRSSAPERRINADQLSLLVLTMHDDLASHFPARKLCGMQICVCVVR
jgi:hypothetical protein